MIDYKKVKELKFSV